MNETTKELFEVEVGGAEYEVGNKRQALARALRALAAQAAQDAERVEQGRLLWYSPNYYASNGGEIGAAQTALEGAENLLKRLRHLASAIDGAEKAREERAAKVAAGRASAEAWAMANNTDVETALESVEVKMRERGKRGRWGIVSYPRHRAKAALVGLVNTGYDVRYAVAYDLPCVVEPMVSDERLQEALRPGAPGGLAGPLTEKSEARS